MTRLVYTIIIFLILGINAASQDERKIHLGLVINPSMAILTGDGNDQIKNTPQPGGFIGALAHVDLHFRWQLRVGAGINVMAIEQKDYSPLFPSDVDSMGNIFPRNSSIEYKLTVYQISVPVNVRFKLADKTNHFFLSSGIDLRFKVDEKDKSILIESGSGSLDLSNSQWTELNTFGLTYSISAGYEFSVFTASKLSVEPIFKFGVNQIFETSGLHSVLDNNGHTIEFGLSLGLIL